MLASAPSAKSAATRRNPTAHGIFNAGHDGVTIRGGTVRGFGAYGVRLAGAFDNQISGGSGPGIFVQTSPREPARRHRIAGNQLTGNGIVAYDPSTILQANVSTQNHGRGIYTPNGLVDNGGNQASANGLP